VISAALDAGEAAERRAEEVELAGRALVAEAEVQRNVAVSVAERGKWHSNGVYLLEKERRIAAEDRCMRLEGEIAELTSQEGNMQGQETQIENAAAQPGRQCRVTEKLKGLTELMRANGVHRLELESALDGQMSIRAIELEKR
jgi:hypothetical protein